MAGRSSCALPDSKNPLLPHHYDAVTAGFFMAGLDDSA
jgi:hypothetical protein